MHKRNYILNLEHILQQGTKRQSSIILVRGFNIAPAEKYFAVEISRLLSFELRPSE
jgi:hypothetical protein